MTKRSWRADIALTPTCCPLTLHGAARHLANPMKLSPRCQLVRAFAVASALVIPVLLRAQSATPTAAEDPVVQLDTFKVSSAKDYGYRATNAITATGIGVEIDKTPISVSVITADLMKDLGAVELTQSVAYTASIQMDTRNTASYFIRGFPVPLLVNNCTAAAARGDSWASLPNPSFTERIELAKGPNSVFFGRVAPAGVVNLITLPPP